MKILTIEQMRQVERECEGIGLPSNVLMENAGRAVAEETRRILGDIKKQNIAVLVGPGNNGGDGLVAARYLSEWGAKVSLYLLGKRSEDDANLEKVRHLDSIEANAENLDKLDEWLFKATVVIDAIFGTGKSRKLEGIFAEALARVTKVKERRNSLRIIALDLPSGLDADTSAIDPTCLYADSTITLGFPKPGLFNFPGAERVGKVTVVDIGTPANLAENVTTELITDDWARSVLPKRPLGANKGTFGKVLVVAGSINYIGAAYLACIGAIRVGTGLVTLATASSLQPILASKLTEITYLPLPEAAKGIISPKASLLINQELGNYNVMLLGCGLGQSESAIRFIKAVLFRSKPNSLVLDADALNTLAATPNWWRKLFDDAILTPHPGEMARLAGISVEDVQKDRLGLAVKMAQDWNKTVVLKGAYSVIAAPDGRVRVSPIANPGLASAGIGDVLAGVIAGLVAQGLDLFDAAALGVYLHGKAGDRVRETLGDTGMIATDLLPELPLVIKQLKESAGQVG